MVIVTVTGLLVEPAPIDGKVMEAGVTWIPPEPIKATLEGMETDGELTVSMPVAAALVAGAKATETAHCAPAPRLPAHPFRVSTKGTETAMDIDAIVEFVALVMVTV